MAASTGLFRGTSTSDPHLVFLVAFHESLGTRHVLGQLVRVDQGLHVMHPGDQVAVVGHKALELVGLLQADATLISLGNDRANDR